MRAPIVTHGHLGTTAGLDPRETEGGKGRERVRNQLSIGGGSPINAIANQCNPSRIAPAQSKPQAHLDREYARSEQQQGETHGDRPSRAGQGGKRMDNKLRGTQAMPQVLTVISSVAAQQLTRCVSLK